MGRLLIQALISRYNAQKEEALALLTLYINNPSAVADHTGLVDEVDRLVQKLATAENLLATLESNIRVDTSDHRGTAEDE